MKRTILMAILAAAIIFPSAARAASLWQDGSDLYADQKARYVGDIITILVSEVISANQTSSTSINQDEQMAVKDENGFIAKFINAFGVKAQDQYETAGTTKSSNNLATTMAAEVVEVLPNGNLVIEARRSIVVNKETQIMVLSGTVRSRDITKENKINSSSIANAQIRYEGRGQIAKRQKPGLLNKIFDFIF